MQQRNGARYCRAALPAKIARLALGKPAAPVPRSCSSCFIWSRSGIGNSFNRNLAPAHGPESPRVYDAIAAFI